MLANRTRSRADQLRSDFGAKIKKVVDWMKVQNYLNDAANVINTTSLGMVEKQTFQYPRQIEKKYACYRHNLYAT